MLKAFKFLLLSICSGLVFGSSIGFADVPEGTTVFIVQQHALTAEELNDAFSKNTARENVLVFNTNGFFVYPKPRYSGEFTSVSPDIAQDLSLSEQQKASDASALKWSTLKQIRQRVLGSYISYFESQQLNDGFSPNDVVRAPNVSLIEYVVLLQHPYLHTGAADRFECDPSVYSDNQSILDRKSHPHVPNYSQSIKVHIGTSLSEQAEVANVALISQGLGIFTTENSDREFTIKFRDYRKACDGRAISFEPPDPQCQLTGTISGRKGATYDCDQELQEQERFADEEEAERQRLEEEQRRLVEEEAERKRLEEEQKRLAEEEEQKRLGEEDPERKRLEEEQRRLAEEEAERQRLEEEQKRLTEEEAERKRLEEEQRRLAEQEAERQRLEEEQRRLAEEEAERKRLEEEQKRLAEEEERKRRLEEERLAEKTTVPSYSQDSFKSERLYIGATVFGSGETKRRREVFINVISHTDNVKWQIVHLRPSAGKTREHARQSDVKAERYFQSVDIKSGQRIRPKGEHRYILAVEGNLNCVEDELAALRVEYQGKRLRNTPKYQQHTFILEDCTTPVFIPVTEFQVK